MAIIDVKHPGYLGYVTTKSNHINNQLEEYFNEFELKAVHVHIHNVAERYLSYIENSVSNYVKDFNKFSTTHVQLNQSISTIYKDPINDTFLVYNAVDNIVTTYKSGYQKDLLIANKIENEFSCITIKLTKDDDINEIDRKLKLVHSLFSLILYKTTTEPLIKGTGYYYNIYKALVSRDTFALNYLYRSEKNMSNPHNFNTQFDKSKMYHSDGFAGWNTSDRPKVMQIATISEVFEYYRYRINTIQHYIDKFDYAHSYVRYKIEDILSEDKMFAIIFNSNNHPINVVEIIEQNDDSIRAYSSVDDNLLLEYKNFKILTEEERKEYLSQ